MSAFKLVVVRTDAIVHTSKFSGWLAECAMIKYRDDMQADARTVSVTIFDGYREHGKRERKWVMRSQYVAEPKGGVQ